MSLTKIVALLACHFLAVSTGFAAGDAAKGQDLSSACKSCHGATGLSTGEDYPNIAGQKRAYLVKALKQYQSGQRPDTTMQALAGPLSTQDIEDLAAYFASNAVIP